MKITVSLFFFLLVALFSQVTLADPLQLSMLPNYSAEEINKRITPLAGYLAQKTGQQVEARITANFAQYEAQVQAGSIQIGFAPPSIYCRLADKQQVLAMASGGEGKEKMRGVIIARADSDIKKIEDLKNRKIMVVGRHSTGGYLSQRASLTAAGIELEKDCQVFEAVDNKEENVVLAVYLGDAAAGFISEATLEQVSNFIPVNQLQTIQKTVWLPNWALSVGQEVAPEVRKTILEALLKLGPTDPVSRALKISKFVLATDADFDQFRTEMGLPVPTRQTAAP